MWIVIGIVACLAMAGWSLYSYDIPEWIGGIGFTGALFLVVVGIVALIAQADFRPAMAAAVQVRAATERLGCTASEDVLGKAADFNADVMSNRVWNHRWIGDPFINDGVDTVTLIAIPECR